MHKVSSSELMIVVLLAIVLCSCESTTDESPEFSAFGSPERVTITGYDGDIMEPFVSRDGRYLLFNNAGGPTDKDLFYAESVNETTFAFRGEIKGVNTSAVDGAPTMDSTGRLYFVSTHAYNPPTGYDTLFVGDFDVETGNVTGITPLSGLARSQPGQVNFDIEVSPDGGTLYFNDGLFSGNPFPDGANIAIAIKQGERFERHPDSAKLLEKVNTTELDYAPSISADGLELFFTRLNVGNLETKTYRTTRSDISSPFETPQQVKSIEGFAEGATLSPDGKSLYFHKEEDGRFVLYRVSRSYTRSH